MKHDSVFDPGSWLFLSRAISTFDFRVRVPKTWDGTAIASATRWSDDGNTVEVKHEISFNVELALLGIPPATIDVPLEVWGAIVAIIVEARVHARAIQAVTDIARLTSR